MIFCVLPDCGTEAQFVDMAYDMMLEPNWKDVADFIL
jgi:hypothetical protein